MIVSKHVVVILLVFSTWSPCSRQEASEKPAKEQFVAVPEIQSEGSTLPDAGQVIEKVSKRYSGVTLYSARGVNTFRSTLIHRLSDQGDIPLHLEYRRGKNATIEWQVKAQSKTFRLDGGKAWLEIDGKRSEEYRDLRDGLIAISQSETARSLCLVDSFVFHDEITPGRSYFAELVAPKISGEAEVDGKRCYILSGSFRGVEGESIYWIDAEDGLIRRIERTIIAKASSSPGARVDKTTTSETYFDIEIETGKSSK